MSKEVNRLLWIDLEMTGLNPDRDRIIEIATIVTDDLLNIIAEGPVMAINQTDRILDEMDDWNLKHHSQSGLIERVQKSKLSEKDAQAKTLDFVSLHLSPGQSPMCGNSICQDRRFLYRYMPKLEAFFHYRNLDVSTIKELTKRWRPDLVKGIVKENTHEALNDIRESIAELRYYRQHFFKLDTPHLNDS